MAAQVISHDDIVLNRQINFLVMRKMWQIIRGRAQKGSMGEQTIYKAFGMSRERYTRVLNGENVRFSKKELKLLMQKTGLRSEIFEGKDCFQFEGISRKSWTTLFLLRGQNIKKAREYEKNLYEQTQPSDADILNNPDIYRFAVYLKRLEPATNTTIEERLQENIEVIQRMEFQHLEQCGEGILKNYLMVLQKQVDMVETLTRYAVLRQESKKK